jgi:RNA 3'-terminal phosphate cyclase (ATP)
MIEIDGSQGEGGGQIIRSSLALAAVTQQSIKLKNIRAGRKKPGLLRQHLTAVRATAKVCNADVRGAELGAREIAFVPQEIRGGDFEFKIGTAGSASLVGQTVLPALMLADTPSTVTLEGGTHNQWAPPFDFLQRAFLPQLAKAGPQVTAEIDAYGFYPAGGGRFRLSIDPCRQLAGFRLLERDEKPQPRVTAIVSGIARAVGERECDTIRRKTNWTAKCFEVREVDNSIGPGNVVMIELQSRDVTEITTGFGKVGVKAEQVARATLREARTYLSAEVPVGEYLADQLMMPMGLAASQGKVSEFRTVKLSKHSLTHIDVLKTFLDINIEVIDEGNERFLVKLSS